VDVPRSGDRLPSERHGVRGHDRPESPRTTQRRAGLAKHGSGKSEAATERGGYNEALERGGVGERAQGVALPYQHAGDAGTTGSTHELVAGHVGVAADELWPERSSSRVVRLG